MDLNNSIGCIDGRGANVLLDKAPQCCVHAVRIQKGCLLFVSSLHSQPYSMAAPHVTCQGLSWPGLCGDIHLKPSLLETTYLRASTTFCSLKAPPAVYTDL